MKLTTGLAFMFFVSLAVAAPIVAQYAYTHVEWLRGTGEDHSPPLITATVVVLTTCLVALVLLCDREFGEKNHN